MGTWKLEVLRMFMYVSFPVGMFHIFNNPQYFEKYVIEAKRKGLPPRSEEFSRELNKLKESFRKKQELEIDEEFAQYK